MDSDEIEQRRYFTINTILQKIFCSVKRALPSALIAPIAPFLGWGPVTHAYINEKTLKHLDNLGGVSDRKTDEILKSEKSRKYFILTAGYPDVIKTKGFLKGDLSYDYAHNPLPNRYYGQPQFAIELYRHFLESTDDELLIFALSWRAHQVADVFAHHVPLDEFWGFANRATFFEPFWNEAVEHLGKDNIGDLAGAFYRANHWISELVVDLFCYLQMGAEWSLANTSLIPDRPLKYLEDISRDYLKKYSGNLKREYRIVEPIELEQIRLGREFSEILNTSTCRYFKSLIAKRTGSLLLEMIGKHEHYSTLERMLDNVSYATATALINPSHDWIAPTVSSNGFLFGASDYDSVFPGQVTGNEYDKYYSEEVEKQWLNHHPQRRGLVKLVLEKLPMRFVRRLALGTSLITSGGFVSRMLVPNSRNPYGLSLRYTFNLRERSETDFLVILRRTLEEVNLIKKN